MGRFSPSVLPHAQPTFGQQLADAFSGGIDEYRDAKQRKRIEGQQSLQDALVAQQLGEQGISKGTAPQVPAPLQFTPKPGAFNPMTGTFDPSSIQGTAPSVGPLGPAPGVQQLTPDYYQDTNVASANRAERFREQLAQTLAETEGKSAIEANAYMGKKTFDYNLSEPDRQAERDYRQQSATRAEAGLEETKRHNRASEAEGHYTFIPAVDESGKPVIARGSTRTGEVVPTQVGRPSAPTGGAAGEMQAVRIATAAGQATDADKLMTTYEDQVLAGKAQFTATDAYLAKKMLSAGAGVSTVAESTLNSTNPRLAGYIRAAKAAASAERMITPRGGSNALMSAETMLSGAGASADRGLIEQARGYRKRLVQGLSAHVGNQPGNTGDINLSHPNITETIDQMIREGKSDAEIQAMLAGGH